MFRTVPLSIIRSFSLYTQQWYMSHIFVDSSQAVSFSLYTQQWYVSYRFAVFTVKSPGDGHRNCPKHVEFYSKNKFEELECLVAFIIRIYHDARSPERQNSGKGLLEFFMNHFNKFTNKINLIKYNFVLL